MRSKGNSSLEVIFKVILHPHVSSDSRAAFDWYESQSDGLGSEFLLSAEATEASVGRNPEQYPKVHNQIRRAMIVRFPFGIFYSLAGKTIYVLAVFHARRNPSEWKERVK